MRPFGQFRFDGLLDHLARAAPHQIVQAHADSLWTALRFLLMLPPWSRFFLFVSF
jgi:hypothetical protein